MTSRSDRTMRVIAFVLGALAAVAVFDFIYSNQGSQNLDWLGFRFLGLPAWGVGVVALLAGLALGYAYHFPARRYHQSQHKRYAEMATRLQAENDQLRQQTTLPVAEPPAPPPPEEAGNMASGRSPKVKSTPVANA